MVTSSDFPRSLASVGKFEQVNTPRIATHAKSPIRTRLVIDEISVDRLSYSLVGFLVYHRIGEKSCEKYCARHSRPPKPAKYAMILCGGVVRSNADNGYL